MVYYYLTSAWIISIHALREEGDDPIPPPRQQSGISIHALREEGDLTVGDPSGPESVFLSTPSARRATPAAHRGRPKLWDFYPRPPRGGRHTWRRFLTSDLLFLSTPSARRATATLQAICPINVISIHALREEGDRRAVRPHRAVCISIHALREEGDVKCHANSGAVSNFYPRPPRGGRLVDEQNRVGNDTFLSTPSARRATNKITFERYNT